MRRTSQSALLYWGRTRSWEGATDPSLVDLLVNRSALERRTGGGESPVGDGQQMRVRDEREYCRTRDIWWEAGPTTAQG